MNEPEVFVLADRALAGVVARIRPDQWDMTMPPNFARRGRRRRPTLRSVVNYHAYDDAWVPDMLAGRTMDEAGADEVRRRPPGRRPGGELRGDRGRGLRRGGRA